MPGRMVLSQDPKDCHDRWEGGREMLKQALRDEACLNEKMVGVELALDEEPATAENALKTRYS